MASRSEKDEAAVPFLPNAASTDGKLIADLSNHRRKTWSAAIASVCVGLILSSIIWLIAWNVYLNTNTKTQCTMPYEATKSSCGHSPREAVAKGCIFQLWSYSWVPPQCFDKELHEDFLALRDEEDWHYYSDVTTPWEQVPLESVMAGDRNDLHSTWGQHFWHCAFYQRKFFRIVDQHDGKRMPVLKMTNRDLDAEHSQHCQKWLANPSLYPWDEVRINLTVGFHECS